MASRLNSIICCLLVHAEDNKNVKKKLITELNFLQETGVFIYLYIYFIFRRAEKPFIQKYLKIYIIVYIEWQNHKSKIRKNIKDIQINQYLRTSECNADLNNV